MIYPFRLPPGDRISIDHLKVGVPVEYHCEHLSDEVLETWNEIANLLKHNGATVKEVLCLYNFCVRVH